MKLGELLLLKLIQEQRIAEFLRLKEEFFDTDERRAYTLVKNHVDQYGLLPSEDLLRGRARLTGRAPDSYGFYHDEIVKRFVTRRIDRAASDIAEISDPFAKLEILNRLIEESHEARANIQRQLTGMSDIAQRVLNDIPEARYASGMTGIPTSYPTLDRTTRGFQNGGLYVIAARVKMGKSMMMIRMANAAHQAGYIPLMISMEMKAEQIGRRHLALRAGIQMDSLLRGTISTFGVERLEQEQAAMAAMHPYHFIEGQYRKDVADIASLVHSLRPHIIFIDGAYLLHMRASKFKAKWEIVSDVAQGLMDIAGNNNIPLVASFQFTREVKRGTSRTPQDAGMEHIHLSDAISQLATCGIGLLESPDQDRITASRRRLVKVLGGREGEGGEFPIHWDWNQMLFDEIDTGFSMQETREPEYEEV